MLLCKKPERFLVSLQEEEGLGSPSLPRSQALHRGATWCRRTFQCCCTKYFWKLPLLIIYRDVPEITPTSPQPPGLGKPFYPHTGPASLSRSSLPSPPPAHANNPASATLSRPPPRLHPPAAEAAPFNRRLCCGPAAASRARLPRPAPRPTPASSRPAAARPSAPKTQSTYPEIEPTASSFLVGGLGRGKVGRGERGGNQGGFHSFPTLKKEIKKKTKIRAKKAQQYLLF